MDVVEMFMMLVCIALGVLASCCRALAMCCIHDSHTFQGVASVPTLIGVEPKHGAVNIVGCDSDALQLVFMFGDVRWVKKLIT